MNSFLKASQIKDCFHYLNILTAPLLGISVFIFIGSLFLNAAEAQVGVRLLLTSNIQGRSVPKIENQETEDPLLILAQNIVTEKETGVDLYVDLGNGFYPGLISKFSSGSIMMDFFEYLDCAASLVSSRDLQIGVQNLEFLQKSKDVHLISANIKRPTGPVFSPYFLKEIRRVPIAFVGISSRRLEFDIAEKDLYGTDLVDEKEALEATLNEIGASGIEHIVLLSGLRLIRTLQLLESYKKIDLAICGGDYTGRLYDSKASRIDLTDGRSLIMLDRSFDYYTVDLAVEDKILLQSVQPVKAIPQRTYQENYLLFKNRLTLWKEKYQAERHQHIAEADEKEYILNDRRLLQLMRDRFNSEVAIVDSDTINPYPIKKDIRLSDLLQLVNLDYKIFTFHLKGDHIAKIVDQQDDADLVITGVAKGEKIKIQGYPLDNNRRYSVVATQSVLKKIRRFLDRKVKYRNSWSTVTDILIEDLQNEKVVLRDDYTYLDKRFRTLVDAYLANFITTADVDKGPEIKKPSDQPEKSYYKWGFENQIDVSFYNQSHQLVFTPYINYARQDDKYLNNLLRGTLLYEYNFGENLRPYNKFQCDADIDKIDDQRRILIRETVGGSYYGDYLTGKLGLGFEKKVQDPVEGPLYGLETIAGFSYPFLKYFTYTLDIDSFISAKNPENGQWGIRSEVDNVLSIRVNTFLSISLKHKYFYLYEIDPDDHYRSSQIFTTLDLQKDWKFW